MPKNYAEFAEAIFNFKEKITYVLSLFSQNKHYCKTTSYSCILNRCKRVVDVFMTTSNTCY